MKVIDCFWENSNIGRKTIEMIVDPSEIFEKSMIASNVDGYEYAVVKVPMNMPTFNLGLSEMGFACIENQINLAIGYTDFDFDKLSPFYDDTFYVVVDSKEGLQEVVEQIKPGMFSTDRITIDSHFGQEIGCRRYINWLRNEYESGKSQLITVNYKGKQVGFMLVRFEQGTVNLLLNGLYKPYQGKGLGLLTPASPMLYVKKNSMPIERETTSISSNNIPVLKLYNRLHFQIISQTYVFVKHNYHDTF